jgi:DNA-binding winged helix-turn-helix (wHTH) protein/TolB-like protein
VNNGAPNQSFEVEPRVRLGGFFFDRVTGELVRADAQDGEGSQRLPPQPAQLLDLLIEHAGELVSHQAIRDRLWGDVEVDFEQGLHFCVRQVRAALDDSAAAPRYIETLPRRGYRLLVPAEPAETDSPGEGTIGGPARSDGPPPPARPKPWLAVAILALFAMIGMGLTSVWLTGRATSGPVLEATTTSDAKAVTLAVMTFRPMEDLGLKGDPVAIAEGVLVRLALVDPARLGVIGPTTTESYGTDLGSVHQLTEAIEVDYVLNGRWSRHEGRTSLIVELIRAQDGAHVWVERFDPITAHETIAERAAAATLEVLGF